MKRTLKIKYLPLFSICCILMLTLVSCGKSTQNPTPQQQSTEEQSSEKVPDQLMQMEASIESIFKALEGPAASQDEQEEKKQEPSREEQNQSNQQEGSQKQGDGEKAQGGQEGSKSEQQAQEETQQKGQQPQQQPKDPWKEISPVMNTLHYQWNEYMPQAVKSGANKALIDNFSNALNTLTGTIIKEEKTPTLMAANNLYSYIPDFYGLYKEKASPEIKRIRYYSRNALLNGMISDWTKAESDMNNLTSSWSFYKNTLNEKQQEASSKLDLSILEFEKVIKQKNQPLTDIKGRVVLSNVDALEKNIKEEAKITSIVSEKKDSKEGQKESQQP